MKKLQLSDKLLYQRRKKELTQQQVATAAGITRSMYNKIERGERRPSPKVAKAIAATLDLDWCIFYEAI
jgi:transcriptional regulator with XRE-family HTH domain